MIASSGMNIKVRASFTLSILIALALSVSISAAESHAAASNGAIAYTADADQDGRYELHLLHPNGSSELLSNEGNIDYPTFSGDGKKLAFQSTQLDNWGNLGTYIYTIGLVDRRRERLTNGFEDQYEPAFSQSSDTVAFLTPGSRLKIKRAGDNFTIDWTPNGIDSVFSPAWAPDGTDRIAFAGRNNGVYNIFTYVPGRIDQITHFEGDETIFHPSWSPDGTQIAFTHGDLRPGGDTNIYKVDLRTNTLDQLTNTPSDDTDPTWSPDGKKIAFISERDGKSEIYSMNADGTNETNLTGTANVDEWTPTWQPIQRAENPPAAPAPKAPSTAPTPKAPSTSKLPAASASKLPASVYKRACNLRITSPKVRSGKRVRTSRKRVRRLFTHGAKGYVRWGKVAGKPVKCEKIKMLLVQRRGSRHYVPGTNIRVSKKALSISRFSKTVSKLKKRGIGKLRQKRVARKKKTNISFKDFNRRSKRGKRALGKLKKRRYRGVYVFVYTAVVDGKTIKKRYELKAK